MNFLQMAEQLELWSDCQHFMGEMMDGQRYIVVEEESVDELMKIGGFRGLDCVENN